MLKNRILITIGVVFLSLAVIGMVFYNRHLKSGASFVTGLISDTIELGQDNNNINVLVLGIAGGNHAGPNLSDTIIFANIKPSENQVSLVSIPRDLWISDLQLKINAVYATGIDRKSAIPFTKEAIGGVVGKKIDYILIVNFSGFEKLIDLLGGVDIDVQRSFDDYFYPVAGLEDDLCGYKEEEKEFNEEEAKQLGIKPGKVKVLLNAENKLATAAAEPDKSLVYTDEQVKTYFACRFEHLSFTKGPTHMNGEIALKFVRSRHGLGAEGTDFARSQRQHLVISAVKEKLFSLGTIVNPTKLIGIYNLVKENIYTDIPVEKTDDFVNLAKRMQNVKIKTVVIDAGDTIRGKPGLLVSPAGYSDYNGQWVLISRIGSGNFSEIHTYIDCIVQGKSCEVGQQGIDIYEEKEKDLQ